MPSMYEVLGPEIRNALHDERRDFAYDVLLGLSEQPKRLPSKYFYDDAGSALFTEITGLDAYYPTRCERSILERDAGAIVESMLGGGPFNLVDLGAGDGQKTMVLIDELARRGADFRYVPIDISEAAMRVVVDRVHAHSAEIEVAGLVCEYVEGVHYLGQAEDSRRNLVLFLGSNIGNFNRVQARGFLRRLGFALGPEDRILVGFDLKKDIEVLLAAYNDPKGVTSRFNLNLLARINRELEADFVLDRFRHFGTYNVFSGAMESYLVSLEPQEVRVGALSQSFHFDAWEPVHTEYSYKYLRSDAEGLAEDTGFEIIGRFEDERGWFLDALFAPSR